MPGKQFGDSLRVSASRGKQQFRRCVFHGIIIPRRAPLRNPDLTPASRRKHRSVFDFWTIGLKEIHHSSGGFLVSV
jgi:hypothetical protein